MSTRSKFNVRTDAAGIEARTADNIVFDSVREKNRYLELKMLLRSGIIHDLELQVEFPLVVNGALICKWICDFRYQTLDNKTVIEDSKGARTPVYVLKSKLFHALHPDLRIIEL